MDTVIRMAKKQWSDLSPRARAAIVIGSAIELALTAVALRDLSKRPATSVRGPKLAWRLASFVQPIGPIAYLVAGRRN